MPVFGYIAYPVSGAKNDLAQELGALEYCQVIPADNEKVLVLVTDTPDKDSEKKLQKQLKNLKSLESLSMTFGYNDEQQKEKRGEHNAG